jgi:proteasome lid subunit RPN8/RPN11
VVIPAAVRAAIVEHAAAEAPNEACGLVVLRDRVAERYEPGVNAAPSPYYFELQMPDPAIWFLEDEGYELAVVHSHLSSEPRPSRTDVENVGLWRGRPYLIYSLRLDRLAAWEIGDGGAVEVPLAEPVASD